MKRRWNINWQRIFLTSLFYRSESTTELNQIQGYQLLSNTSHSPQSNPNVRLSCFLDFSSVPLTVVPKETQLMSQNPIRENCGVNNLQRKKRKCVWWMSSLPLNGRPLQVHGRSPFFYQLELHLVLSILKIPTDFSLLNHPPTLFSSFSFFQETSVHQTYRGNKLVKFTRRLFIPKCWNSFT